MSEEDAKVEQIRNLLEARRFDLAKQLLAPLLATWPDHAGLWQLQAIAHLGAEEYAEAQGAASQAISRSPQDASLYLLMCRVLVAWDRIGEGVAWAQRALELEPNSADAHLQIANGLATVEKHLDQALWHAQRARDLEPDSALTHCVLGMVLLSMGGRSAARQAREPLETALRLDPQLPGAWNCLGLSALRTGRFVASLRAFITTLQLDPQSDNGSHNLPLAVWALVSRGRWWVFGLLIPMAALTGVAYVAGGITAVAVHVVGAVLIAAGAWWALVLRILRVFPQSMRLAASNVLRRDRLVRPTWIGLAVGAAAQVLAVAAPLGPGGFGLAFWLTAIANFVGHRVSNSRLKRATRALNAEREAQWRNVVTAQAPVARPANASTPETART